MKFFSLFSTIIFSLLIVSACDFNYSTVSERPAIPIDSESEIAEPQTEDVDDVNQEPETSQAIPKVTAEPFVQNLEIPWAMVWTSAERLLVTERPGRIRQVLSGELQDQSLHEFEQVLTGGEQGLLGMTKDPNYDQNQWLYVCYSLRVNGNLRDRIVRFTDEGDQLTNETLILENIPAAQYHAGCELDFGPDGKLYATAGDATERNLAQNLDSLAGKLLRMNPDGSIPEDNPIPNSYIWSYGHRNAQGIDWHPISGALYSAEHGPSVFDGPPGGDELNHIVKKGNYGWPVVSHTGTAEGMVDPLEVYTPAFAPGSLLITSENSNVFPTGTILIAGLRGEDIRAIQVSTEDPNNILESQLLELNLGRIRELSEGPDGSIYFATSNRDGRGTVRNGDDVIYKLSAETES